MGTDTSGSGKGDGSQRLTLPYPPSANRYWRTAVVKGRAVTYVSAEAKLYRVLTRIAFISSGLKCVPLGDIAVTLRVYRPRKAGDVTNREKVLGDALNGLAWTDDGQISESHLYRFDDRVKHPAGAVEITWGPA